jgi:hypothetical protein
MSAELPHTSKQHAGTRIPGNPPTPVAVVPTPHTPHLGNMQQERHPHKVQYMRRRQACPPLRKLMGVGNMRGTTQDMFVCALYTTAVFDDATWPGPPISCTPQVEGGAGRRLHSADGSSACSCAHVAVMVPCEGTCCCMDRIAPHHGCCRALRWQWSWYLHHCITARAWGC